MSIEALWYASYTPERQWGNRIIPAGPPKCNRLTRLPSCEQLGMAFDLALDFPAGRAGFRSVGRISTTGETYWWWPRENVKHGEWWMLPERTIKLMDRATTYAQQRASRPRLDLERWSPPSDYDRVRVELRRLQRRAHRAAEYVRAARIELPPYEAHRPQPNKLRAIQPPPKRDSPLLLAARRAREFLVEVRYGLTLAAASRRHLENPYPEWGALKVETNDGDMPIVDAVRYWAREGRRNDF